MFQVEKPATCSLQRSCFSNLEPTQLNLQPGTMEFPTWNNAVPNLYLLVFPGGENGED
jgi:hypothetical protein